MREIGRECPDPLSVHREPRGRGSEGRGVAIDEQHGSAADEQRFRHRGTDAAAATGDEDPCAGEPHALRLSPAGSTTDEAASRPRNT